MQLMFLRPRPRSQSGQRSNSCIDNNSKTTEANLTKLHRKIEHHEKVSCRQLKFLRPRSRLQSGQRSNSCLGNNSKTTKATLTKLHRKIEHHEKVCCAQEFGSYAQGQGHNQVRDQIVHQIMLLINF